MKFLDFASFFDADPANLALLSTFQFDADFFERRLLRCPALVKARRIVVFMDAGQWLMMLRQDVPARFLNRRYLVVPVRVSKGVFHPKLSLLVGDQVGRVHCGSNNLTRSGCASNLELLNFYPFDLEHGEIEPVLLAKEAYRFFQRCCDDAEEETGAIARQWLLEEFQSSAWLKQPIGHSEDRQVRLVHTYDGSLWNRLTELLDSSPPKKLQIISPFYDLDAELAHRISERWPQCRIEMIVQQQTTTLPVARVKKLRSRLSLSELRNSSRRLHAKLVSWESRAGSGCLVGSANLTAAAFDARNVEVCLLMSGTNDATAKLFDGQLAKRALAFEDFEPGTEPPPEDVESESTTLRIVSAVLSASGELRVTYKHKLVPRPTSLRLAIRTADEQRPRALLNLPNQESGKASLQPSEAVLKDVHGTILVSLVADVGGKKEFSPPMWVVQEDRLTYEPSGGGSSTSQSKVEETGDGLTEFLEELGNRDGIAAVIEYLRRLNIQFRDGGGGRIGGEKFRLRIRDPFHPDVAPEWLLHAKAQTETLAEAIFDFVDRHERLRLRRHAKRGNINGVENFIDIFSTLVRLLYVYHVRGLVHRNQFIGRLSTYLDLATSGIDTNEDYCESYLYSLYENIDDLDYLQEVCDELNLLGHLWAAMVIVQKVRFIPGEQATWGTPPKRPCECLPQTRKNLNDTITDLELRKPSKADVLKALAEYKLFSTDEIAALEREIVI